MPIPTDCDTPITFSNSYMDTSEDSSHYNFVVYVVPLHISEKLERNLNELQLINDMQAKLIEELKMERDIWINQSERWHDAFRSV